MKPYIVWDAHERAQLIERARLLIHGDDEVTEVMQALRLAQAQVLPPNRRREHLQMRSVPWFAEAVADAIERAAVRRGKPTPAPTAELAPGGTASSTPDHLEQALTALLTRVLVNALRSPEVAALLTPPKTVAVAPAPVPVSVSSPTLSPAEVKPVVTLPPFSQPGPRVKHNPEPPTTAKPCLPRVMIAGLLGQQVTEIDREFCDLLDLRFISADARPEQVKAQAEGADYTLLMIKFVSHSLEAIIRKATDSLVRVNGGIGDLKRELQNIINKLQVSRSLREIAPAA